MRFSTAWAKTAAQNVTLKLATVILAIVVTMQLILIATLSAKDPLIIERSCYSKSVAAKAADPNQEEIKYFLLEALPQRFDSSGYLKDGFLSIEETLAREKEQAALKQRQMSQRIVISDIKIEGKEITVLSDRLVSIGKIKSALTLNLKVAIQQSNRTESNPYGLIISSINQIEDKKEDK